MKKYPSQKNRVHFWISPEHLEIAKGLAQTWTAETSQTWSAKGVVEALLVYAEERHIKPVSELR